MNNKKIGIIGAGPGGLKCAERLAFNNIEALLFDDKAPWDKPCCGVLGVQLTDNQLSLTDYTHDVKYHDTVLYISPRAERVTKPLHGKVPVISRDELSEYMLQRALNTGAQYINTRVTSIMKNGSKWTITADAASYDVDVIVGADGVNSVVRKEILGNIPHDHLYISCGYYIHGAPADTCIIKFPAILGYIWFISHTKHANAGILVKYGSMKNNTLFKILDDFMKENIQNFEIQNRYSYLIPSASDPDFLNTPCSGDNWILIGDAAGHTEPLLGEGIYFALESGRLAAQSIIENDIVNYDNLWKRSYGNILINNAKIRADFLTLADDFGAEMYGAMMYHYFCR